jgi:hypothetical protein
MSTTLFPYLRAASALVFAALVCTAQPAAAQFVQQGTKLVGTGSLPPAHEGSSVALSANGSTMILGGPTDDGGVGSAWVFIRSGATWTQQGTTLNGIAAGDALFGSSVAISADGNTAIVGGKNFGSAAGAAWFFTRSGGVWTQQGGTMIGSGNVGNAEQGYSVALSADGNTAIVGGPADNSAAGAAWIFVRSGSTWTQQGPKLVGTGYVPNTFQGTSVALSADGNTALVGGPSDSGSIGATWVFTRSGGVWTQQGPKLVGTGGSIGTFGILQGTSVALSADGNTAIIGAPNDNSDVGATWIFTRSGGVWTQQGSKLVATGGGLANQGVSVALSATGNVAIIGGYNYSGGTGAAWIFSRTGGVWTQGSKITGTGATGAASQGTSVALSADGNTAVLGGPADNSNYGAVWAFVRAVPTNTHDFNDNGTSDMAWRQSGGTAAEWLMSGAQIAQAGGYGVVPTNWQLVGQRDFNGDGMHDWLWRDATTGTVAIWLLNGLQAPQIGSLGALPTNWTTVGTSDFNGDGMGDILWRDSSTGTVAIWLMNGLSVMQTGTVAAVPNNWTVASTDGKGEIFWRDNSTGTVAIWVMNGFAIAQSAGLGVVPGNWVIVGTGDFDGNGSTDILWRDMNTGTVAVWLMNGLSVAQIAPFSPIPSNWSVAETGDFDGDGKSDILWRDTSGGTVAIWLMNGAAIASSPSVGIITTDWTIQGLNAD